MKKNVFFAKVKNFIDKLITRIHGLAMAQKIAIAVSGTILIIVLGVFVCSGIFYKDQSQESVVAAMIPAVPETESTDTEVTEKLEIERGMKEKKVLEAKEQERIISMSTSSIEKDLKVKISEEGVGLITGVPFKISVSLQGEESQSKEYVDEDMDGVIHIENMEAGKYTVFLQEQEGFSISENSITATVKDQIEYKKVDVKDEIKQEKEINTVVEDTAKNDVVVEAPIIDTVGVLPSTVETTEIPASNVDMSNFTTASVSGEHNSATIKKTYTENGTTEQSTQAAEVDTGTGSLGGRSSEADNGQMVESATVSVPKTVSLYIYGTEVSKSKTLDLKIEGTSSIIKSIDWSISNSQVVELNVLENGNSIQLNALEKGTATVSAVITYFADDKNTEETVTVASSLTVGVFTDNKTNLKDLQGNILYLDKEAKTKATLKDYGTVEVYYGMPKYTGWQTIDGKLYYFDKDHKPLTGEQTIDGIKYNFTDEGYIAENKQTTGIDVSKWQGEIDWKAVADAGIDFAIIRVGYRGASTGVLVEDPYFKKNIKGATGNGIKVGVYFFTQAITEAEAVEEASMALSLVSGYKLEYPIFIDTESASGGRANNVGKAQRTAIIKAFCKTIQNGGYKPGVYASTSWYNDKLNASELSSYTIWVAQYNTKCTYKGKYHMWQYSSKGTVPGIKGNVDMNISYMGI